MRLTFLGSGNAFHDDARLHSSVLIESPGHPALLVDAGSTSLLAARRLGVDLGRVGGLLVSHFHGDHLFGFPFLLLHMSERLRRTTPFEIVGPEGVERQCRALLELAYPRLESRVPLVFREAGSAALDVAGFSVVPMPVTHAPESLGFRVTAPGGPCVAISGDAAFDDRLIRLVAGADLAVIELTLAERGAGEGAHVALPALRERRHELDTERIIFIHTDDQVAAEALRLRLGEPATDGLIVEV